MVDMLEVFNRLINSDNFSCVDRVDLPARDKRTISIPEIYQRGSPGRWLTNDANLKGRLWLHQAKAMEMAAQGHNVVIATRTASGKSLVFQSIALRLLDEQNESAVIVFYPLKALAADQLESWKRVAELAGLTSDVIVKIDGSVRRDERAALLDRARIALMTPDVCHAWLLNEISNKTHRDFLARTSLVVIDEAHVLEGIFGSNFAYLFRRLCVARELAEKKRRTIPLQVIAATATILKPAEHLNALTGLDFEMIGEQDDSSPNHPRSIVHVCPKDGNVDAPIAPFLSSLVDESDTGSFIAFRDSRQGTERIAISVNRDSLVKPYRSGYEAEDRISIENALREGSLRGVVSTSGLELGINIPHFGVGLNVGVPNSRKSFLQRLGRVGRQRPGSFGVFADSSAFRKFGTTLADYYETSVEPSYLYLQNRFMQYAHARCLAEELDMLGASGKKVIPSVASWPNGFAEVFDFSYAGSPAARPREFDQIAKIGSDQPHFNYRLRDVPEEIFSVVNRRGGFQGNSDRVGELNLQQAIREAFPGAIYLHMAKGWHVHDWRNTALERAIRVTPTKNPIIPKPISRTFVNLDLEREGIIEGHFRIGESGLLAECHLQVTERVLGFTDGSGRRLYKELRQEKPGMTPKTRDFRTTGVVIIIDEEWFRSDKRKIADALREFMVREYSILPLDVDAASTNIALIQNGRLKPVSDAVVLFDATHGSLRLTEPAYLQFDRLLEQLQRAANMTPPDDELLDSNIVFNLCQWFEKLGDEDGEGIGVSIQGSGGESWIQVLEEGSVVVKRDMRGVLRDIEITGRELMEFDGALQLFYRYKVDLGSAMVSERDVEKVGDDWNVIYWNPVTNETRESLDESED